MNKMYLGRRILPLSVALHALEIAKLIDTQPHTDSKIPKGDAKIPKGNGNCGGWNRKTPDGDA